MCEGVFGTRFRLEFVGSMLHCMSSVDFFCAFIFSVLIVKRHGSFLVLGKCWQKLPVALLPLLLAIHPLFPPVGIRGTVGASL